MDQRHRAAQAGMAARVALYCWIMIVAIEMIAALDFVAGGGVDVWFASGPIVALAELVVIGTMLLTAIVVGVWIYRAMAVAHLSHPDLTISPGWAVGWYFVPIASLWKPYEAMVEIVESSGARRPGRWAFVRDLIGWWWAAWIGRAFLGMVQSLMSRNPDPEIGLSVAQGVVLILSGVLGIVAAWCLATIIGHVAELQLHAVDPTIFD
ncbi:DUF4328 domain-containing protein [Sphingomonas sp.]|jgi:hypothetical protein|uniref:DUF4328 domain-containing protein n=1 Tax=Sphingomonas sp. TaxID=28214 RepID=UPI002E2F005D|nr:DUF4328 domain-containing protein [Sphingomonas sp.]HEX4695666.1 DUF4328 domain-containing protein [Sphingomonas sp.]